MNFKPIIDSAVNSARFKIDDCIDFERFLDPIQSQKCALIKAKLSAKEFKAFQRQRYFLAGIGVDVGPTLTAADEPGCVVIPGRGDALGKIDVFTAVENDGVGHSQAATIHQGAGKEICGIEDIFEEGRPVVIDGPGPEDVKGIGRVERDDKAQKLPVLLRLHRILDPHVDGNEEENEKRQDFEIGYIHGIPLPSLGYMTNIEQDIFCGLSLAGGQRILYTSAVVPRTYLNPVYHY